MNEVCFLQTERYDSTFVCCFRSQPSPITSKRIHNIIDYLTYEVWRYSCRGLYEAHKFLFTLLLAFKIDLQTKKVRFFYPLYLRPKCFDLVGTLCTSPYVH